MSGLVSLSASKSTKGLKVNVVNASNINLSKNKTQTTNTLRQEESIVPVVYASTLNTEETNEDGTAAEDITKEYAQQITRLTNEVSALKLIIDILQNNPFYINKFVVADDTVLMEVIKLLTNADDIVVDAEDILEGCISLVAR